MLGQAEHSRYAAEHLMCSLLTEGLIGVRCAGCVGNVGTK